MYEVQCTAHPISPTLPVHFIYTQPQRAVPNEPVAPVPTSSPPNTPRSSCPGQHIKCTACGQQNRPLPGSSNTTHSRKWVLHTFYMAGGSGGTMKNVARQTGHGVEQGRPPVGVRSQTPSTPACFQPTKTIQRAQHTCPRPPSVLHKSGKHRVGGVSQTVGACRESAGAHHARCSPWQHPPWKKGHTT